MAAEDHLGMSDCLQDRGLSSYIWYTKQVPRLGIPPGLERTSMKGERWQCRSLKWFVGRNDSLRQDAVQNHIISLYNFEMKGDKVSYKVIQGIHFASLPTYPTLAPQFITNYYPAQPKPSLTVYRTLITILNWLNGIGREKT